MDRLIDSAWLEILANINSNQRKKDERENINVKDENKNDIDDINIQFSDSKSQQSISNTTLSKNEINNTSKTKKKTLSKKKNKKVHLHCKQLPQCKHVFHSECVEQWLLIRGDCPICRTIVNIN